MSRKLILSLTAAATFAVASLSSVSADARGFAGGGGFGGGGRGFGGGAAMARLPGGGLPGGGLPGGGHGGCCSTLKPIFPGRPIVPGPFPLPHGHPPGWVFHPHGHGHWVFRFGHWIVVDEVVDEASATVIAPAAIPGPCTCLTKNYTPSGLVVFADVCTKESASAPVDGSAADASQAPTTSVAASAVPMTVVPTTPNYAGKTYDDYLAANPQAANPAPQGGQKN
jgi:hypothetical protein